MEMDWRLTKIIIEMAKIPGFRITVGDRNGLIFHWDGFSYDCQYFSMEEAFYEAFIAIHRHLAGVNS